MGDIHRGGGGGGGGGGGSVSKSDCVHGLWSLEDVRRSELKQREQGRGKKLLENLSTAHGATTLEG